MAAGDNVVAWDSTLAQYVPVAQASPAGYAAVIDTNVADVATLVQGGAAQPGGTNLAADAGHRHAVPHPYNELTNPGLELWNRGVGPFTLNGTFCADSWYLTIPGGTLSVSKDTVNQDVGSVACAACVVTGVGSNSGIVSKLENFAQLRTRQVTASIRVRGAVANGAKLSLIADGSTFIDGTFHSGSGAYETLTVTAVIPGNSTGITVVPRFVQPGTYYVDNASLAVSVVPLDFYPLEASDEGNRTRRKYQRWNGSLTIGAGQATGGATNFVSLPLTTAMGGVPTITISAIVDWVLLTSNGGSQALSSLAIANATGQSVALNASSTVALVAGNATLLSGNNAAGWLALEWNP